MIDLHTHTTASDGTCTPVELVDGAVTIGLEALAITDHDTFAGYDQAVPHAANRGLDLVCGIEMSTKFHGRSVHLLGYFLNADPGEKFRGWIQELQQSRHRRNEALILKLRAVGCDVSLKEWYARGGVLPGRPHLAALLLEKRYVTSIQEAFDRYLAEEGECYTSRAETQISECIEKITQAGGVPVLPHPCRVTRDPSVLEHYLSSMRNMGLRGIEVVHSDHSLSDQDSCRALATRIGLCITGGSDFHGSTKPLVSLGTGIDGNVRVPRAVLDRLRAWA